MTIRILFLIFILMGCQPVSNSSNPPSTNIYDTIYITSAPKYAPAPTYKLTFDLKEYSYGNYTDSILSDWVERLPQQVRDSLIDGHLVVSKHIYLSGIMFNYGEKVERVRTYDHEIERFLYPTIGMSQGLPSVVFSTHFHASEMKGYEDKNFITIKIGKIIYSKNQMHH